MREICAHSGDMREKYVIFLICCNMRENMRYAHLAKICGPEEFIKLPPVTNITCMNMNCRTVGIGSVGIGTCNHYLRPGVKLNTTLTTNTNPNPHPNRHRRPVLTLMLGYSNNYLSCRMNLGC